MYYGHDLYFYNSRKTEKNYWRWRDDNKNPMPPIQILINFLVFGISLTIFGALFIDWNLVAERNKIAAQERSNIVFIGSEKGQEIVKELEVIGQTIEQTAKAEVLTVTDVVLACNKINSLCKQVYTERSSQTLDSKNRVRYITDLYKEVYLKIWPLPVTGITAEEWKTDILKRYIPDDIEENRRQTAEFGFQIHLSSAFVAVADYQCDPLVGFLGLFKAYYFFTLPILICILINIGFVKKSARAVAEKIIFEWREILIALCFGPMGLAFVSETANSYQCFIRFQHKYLANKPNGYRLSRAEEDAIWLQVQKPILVFEQALQNVADGYVYRPALACFLVWLTGFSLFSLGKSNQAAAATTVNTTVADISEDIIIESFHQIIKQQANGSLTKFIGSLNAITPPTVYWETAEVAEKIIEVTRPLRMIDFITQMPRGPPAAVKKDKSQNQESSLNCVNAEQEKIS